MSAKQHWWTHEWNLTVQWGYRCNPIPNKLNIMLVSVACRKCTKMLDYNPSIFQKIPPFHRVDLVP